MTLTKRKGKERNSGKHVSCSKFKLARALKFEARSSSDQPKIIIMFIYLTCLILIIHLIIHTPSSYAQLPNSINSSCDQPSACGNIQNISYPFRLKDDPDSCGHPDRSYELSCENNTTASLYLYKYKYHVRAINYHNFTIRLVDSSITNNDTCSFPANSPKWERLVYFSSAYKLVVNRYRAGELIQPGMVWPVTFLTCPFRLNDPLFVETSRCVSLSSNASTSTYIKYGDMDPFDLRDMCRIDRVALTSLSPSIYNKDGKNDISLSNVHESLLYGFELSWSLALCECNPDQEYCRFDEITATASCVSIYSGQGCKNSYKYLGTDLKYRIFSRYPFRYHVSSCRGGPKSSPYYEPLARMIVILVYCAAVSLVLRILIGMPFYIGLIIYKLRRRHLSMFDLIEGFLQSHNNLMPIRYSYNDIKKITKGFREKLGQGGYGSVYKGKLRSGNIVAVKVLSTPNTNGQDFINEVATMGRIHHINVIKLVGYCTERSKCALLYDFMPNGSLEKYIYTEKAENITSLSWDRKYEIAVGVARGIEYLHRGCDIQILHFDIKPHNILLDDNFNPKISDFGLAKFYSTEKNIVTLTAARGTIGYVAPELINRSIGGVSYKADVYSFGMLLVEIVGLKKNLAANHDENSSTQYFPHWIYDSLNKGKEIEIAKSSDGSDFEGMGKITRRMTIVALWCIQMSPDDRPSMSKVLEMLESDVELLQIPPQPSEFDEALVTQLEDQTWETYSTDSTALLRDGSSLSQDV